MSLTLTIALYFIIWWTVLFAILPLGVRTQVEEGEVVPGSESSAPHRPMLMKKALITTVVSAVVLAVVYLVITQGWITLDTVPIGPQFHE